MSNVTSQEAAVSAVCDALQSVYGDATQTVLDRRAATAVLSTLRQMGWVSIDDVAVLIEAAGGSITVPDRLLLDGRDRKVTAQDDYATGGRRFVVTVAS